MGALGGTLLQMFGPAAFKAVFSGLASAGASAGLMEACNIEDVGARLGAALGSYIVGHAVTWLIPNRG